MIPMKQKDLDRLPPELKGKMQFVHKGMYDMIVGRQKVRAFGINNDSKQWVKVIDRLWTDSIKRFKQNVVLKNPSSHKNALGFNIMMNSSIGVTPKEQYMWTKDASRQMKENKKLIADYSKYKAMGNTTAATRARNKLLESDLFLFEMAGLSTNVVEGLRGNKDLTSYLASNIFKSNLLDSIVNQTIGTQGSKLGNLSTDSFTWLDTTGRYVAARKFEAQGASKGVAAWRANGLYADMEQIAPVAIQFMDDYGIAPFMKWWTQTAPGITKEVKNNAPLAITLGVAMYALSRELEERGETKASSVNMSSSNPIEQGVDFLEMTMYGKWEDMYYDTMHSEDYGRSAFRRVGSNYLPSWLMKPIDQIWLEVNKAEKQKRDMDMASIAIKSAKSITYPNRSKDHRTATGKDFMPDNTGGTQALIEWLIPGSKVKYKRKDYGNRK